MQLLVLILKKVEKASEVLKSLAESGIRGGTILEGKGMAESLVTMEDLPIFGMLRMVLSEQETEASQVMLFVLKEEQIEVVRAVVKKVIGSLNQPNTGIMFSIAINDVEGLGD